MQKNLQTNLVNVAIHYTRILGIPVTSSTLREKLSEHPHFPSLYSLSKVFENLNISNEAFEVEKENLSQLKPPFIAYLKNENNLRDFVLVTSNDGISVKFVAGRKKNEVVPKKVFLENWQQIILKAEASENSGEKDYAEMRRKERIQRIKTILVLLLSALAFLTTIFVFLKSLSTPFILQAAVLLLLKLSGMFASILLLIYEIDQSNPLIRSVCTNRKKTNCSAILQSKASKIAGIHWSEIGFFYFLATFIMLVTPALTFPSKILMLSITSGLASLYIPYSIYYQWKISKQWCPLCLMVQVVLAFELLWSLIQFWPRFSFFYNEAHFSFFELISFLPYIIIPVCAWFFLKSLILKGKNGIMYKREYTKLLHSQAVFNGLLMKQPKAPEGYKDFGITIGNEAAPNTIIKVCNPYCGPCAKAHVLLEEIVKKNKNIKVKLIFTASNNSSDRRGIAARHLLAINATKSKTDTIKALHDWYTAETKDYDSFAYKYPMNGEIKLQEKEIEKMSEWCRQAEISFTPTLYINGYRLPQEYKIEQLINLL